MIWLPTVHETARAALKTAAYLTVAYGLFAAGAAHEARYQIRALQTLHDCRVVMAHRLDDIESRTAEFLVAYAAVLGREVTQ